MSETMTRDLCNAEMKTLDVRLRVIENHLEQIEINSNRLTALETSVNILKVNDVAHLEKRISALEKSKSTQPAQSGNSMMAIMQRNTVKAAIIAGICGIIAAIINALYHFI